MNAVTDTPRPEKPYASRTLPTNPSMMLLHASIFLPWLFLCSAIVPFTFFALTYAQEDAHFTTLGIVAIFCYVASWSPFSVILSPVSAILVIIDRIHRDQFNAVTIAFVAFTFGGLLPGVLYAVLWDVALRDYAYEAWLATFEEDWDEKEGYRIWWWIFGVNEKLMDVGDAVERWIGDKGTKKGGSEG